MTTGSRQWSPCRRWLVMATSGAPLAPPRARRRLHVLTPADLEGDFLLGHGACSRGYLRKEQCRIVGAEAMQAMAVGSHGAAGPTALAAQVPPPSPRRSGRPRRPCPAALVTQLQPPEPPYTPESSCSPAGLSRSWPSAVEQPPALELVQGDSLYNLHSVTGRKKARERIRELDRVAREGTRCGGAHGHASHAEGGGWNASDPPA
jgi:hypothetical protein